MPPLAVCNLTLSCGVAFCPDGAARVALRPWLLGQGCAGILPFSVPASCVPRRAGWGRPTIGRYPGMRVPCRAVCASAISYRAALCRMLFARLRPCEGKRLPPGEVPGQRSVVYGVPARPNTAREEKEETSVRCLASRTFPHKKKFVGRKMGLEPTATWATTRCSTY